MKKIMLTSIVITVLFSLKAFAGDTGASDSLEQQAVRVIAETEMRGNIDQGFH